MVLQIKPEKGCLRSQNILGPAFDSSVLPGFNTGEDDIALGINDRSGGDMNINDNKDKDRSPLSLDILPLNTREQDSIFCQLEHPLPEPSIGVKYIAGTEDKKDISKLTFPSRDIRFHLLDSSSVKNHRKTTSKIFNGSNTSNEDNTQKKNNDITTLDVSNCSTTIPSPTIVTTISTSSNKNEDNEEDRITKESKISQRQEDTSQEED